MMGGDIAYTVSVWTIPVLLAVTLHEAAHGWVAWKLGDDTAKRLGRVTFNPLKHIDPFGTVLLPALLLFGSGGRVMFGYAKPVPVNFNRLYNPRRDMVLVAVAGPLTNLGLAVAAALLAYGLPALPEAWAQWGLQNIRNMLWINCLLFVFNMWPIPPLDGGRVAVGLLPRALAMRLARLERAGIFIVLGALFILPWIGGRLGVNLDVFWWLVGGPAAFVQDMVLTLTGHL
jgi:Zn-dependent protease